MLEQCRHTWSISRDTAMRHGTSLLPTSSALTQAATVCSAKRCRHESRPVRYSTTRASGLCSSRSLMLPLRVLGCLGATVPAALTLTAAGSTSSAHCQEGPTDGGVGSTDELLLVQTIFRHGARTPLTNRYWTGNTWEGVGGKLFDPVTLDITDGHGGPRPHSAHDAKQAAAILPGGSTKGELTLIGQQQSLDYGIWLRSRYVESTGFLPAQYKEGDLLARTTNFRRTVGTLAGVLTGLYSGAGAVPTHTAADLQEIMYASVDSCERLGVLMAAQRQALTDGLKGNKEIAQLEAQVRDALGLSAGTEEHIAFVDLHDALTTLRTHGRPLPAAFTPELLERIEVESTRRMAAIVAPGDGGRDQQDLIRLSVGQLVQLILDRMDAAAAGQTAPKLYLYSGHDTTVMPFLVMLGLKVHSWPKYVSNVVFELWRRGNGNGARPQHYVKVLHNQQHLEHLPRVEKGPSVPLEAFKEHVLGPYSITKTEHITQCKVVRSPESDADTAGAQTGGDALSGI